jgi:hypothetical protein
MGWGHSISEGKMATTVPTRRTFNVALSSNDGLIRISSAETGRVSLALSLEEAAQIRSGLKGALPGRSKKRSKKRSKTGA